MPDVANLLSKSREQELNKPVDEPDAGEADKEDVPGPEDEEVVLVEDVVGEEAENVFPVRVARDPTSPH